MVFGYRDPDILESLRLIKTTCDSMDDEEGKVYHDIPGLGIYIKRK